MSWVTKRSRLGFSGVEILAATGVIALLLTLGVMVHRSLRLAARVTVAQTHLKQISTAMELYFQQYGSYPPQGCDLVAELAPFIGTPEAFANPMLNEETPGQTLNALYVAPTLEELDSPGNYLTAMVSKNGKTALILRTGHRVERRDDLHFLPSELNDALAAVLNPTEGLPGTDEQKEEQRDGVLGLINLNPRNNDDFEFEMLLPYGAPITRDVLHASNGDFVYGGGEAGTDGNTAVQIRVCPKGNGNQNSVSVDGVPYPIRNGRVYIITADITSMSVHLYNVSCNGNGSGGNNNSGNGKAMGRWWIEINAPGGTIVECGGTAADGN